MASDEKRKNVITRESILALLSDAEVAKVSRAEGSRSLIEGDEYVDLENLSAGVRQVHESSPPHTDHLLPRSAVSDSTWAKIVRAVAG